jgi:hypothetical protein
MTDLIVAAHADLVEARYLLASAGGVTWSGPAADAFHERLVDVTASVGALAAAVEAIGPSVASSFRLPLPVVLP